MCCAPFKVVVVAVVGYVVAIVEVDVVVVTGVVVVGLEQGGGFPPGQSLQNCHIMIYMHIINKNLFYYKLEWYLVTAVV